MYTKSPGRVPIDTFSLWILIRDSIDPRHERDKIRGQSLDSPTVKGKGPGCIGDAPAAWEESE